jgi:NAD dependent epimerase/dehydratase family
MDKSEKIFVAGYRGLVGSALIRRLEREGFSNLPKRDRAQLDFTNKSAVRKFFLGEKPAVVIFAAAKVGGIKATMIFRSNFCSKIYGFRTTSSPRLTELACVNFFFLAALAFTPGAHRNRSRKQPC